MNGKIVRTIAWGIVVPVVVAGVAWQAHAQDAKAPYPSMAPIDKYLIADRNAEIALARSAAPESISKDAEVLVLGTAWLRNRSQREERFRMSGGAIVDVRVRLPGILEPQAARSGLLQSASRTNRSATYFQAD